MKIKCILSQGHRVASGLAEDSPFTDGTIKLQKPFFKDKGLDLEPFFMGTLNLNISPYSFNFINPEFRFENIKWTKNFEAETFLFSKCRLIYKDQQIDGYVYYPHPDTKIGHFKDNSILEIIAPKINNISYNDEMIIIINTDEIEVTKG